MIDPVIRVRDVGLTYRTRQSFFRHSYHNVLRGVTFDIYPGETLGIVGRNGSGKSTLLKLLAGIFRPDSGIIRSCSSSATLLGLSVGFDLELSGRENIVFSSMLQGCSLAEAETRVLPVLAFSGLGNYADDPMKTYSTGMRLRLGFSIAIHVRPDLLLIDELLGVGDIEFRGRAEEALENLMSNQTVVLVSHSGAQLKKLCDRAIWLDHGTIRMTDRPDVVLDAYESSATKEPKLYRS